MKQKISVKLLKEDFDKYVVKNYPDSLFEFKEYDRVTEQVFLEVVGEWNEVIRRDLGDFFKKYDKRILVSRMITAMPSEEEI